MRSIISSSLLLAALTILSACGGGGGSEDRQTTETRMDNLDSLEGTISDDAINTDQSTEEGPLEAPPAAVPKGETQRPKADAEKDGPDIMPATTDTDDKADTE